MAEDRGHYRRGSGAPLVLLHGATLSWHSWTPVLDKLSEAHDVYAPTLPGHRGGPALLAGNDIQALVDGVERMLDEQGIGQAHFVGNSLGGWVALELLRRNRALSVVGLSPAGACPAFLSTRVGSLVVTMLFKMWTLPFPTFGLFRIGVARRIAFFGAMNHGERLTPEDAERMVRDARGCLILPPFLRSVATSGQCAPMEAARIPVRIAWAGDDRVIPFRFFGAPLIRRLPGAELVILDGVGHTPMHDDPDLVIRTILDVTMAAGAQRGAV